MTSSMKGGRSSGPAVDSGPSAGETWLCRRWDVSVAEADKSNTSDCLEVQRRLLASSGRLSLGSAHVL